MSQEKAQLIAPEGTFTVPGLNVAGVVTGGNFVGNVTGTASSCLLYTSPSPRDGLLSRMPSSA